MSLHQLLTILGAELYDLEVSRACIVVDVCPWHPGFTMYDADAREVKSFASFCHYYPLSLSKDAWSILLTSE